MARRLSLLLHVAVFLFRTLVLRAAAGDGSPAATLPSQSRHDDGGGRVLVIGGNGFIGLHTVEALVAAGHYQVVMANRNSSYFGSADRLQALGVTTLHWDRRRTPMEELTAYLAAHPRLRGVVDFSCYDGATAHDTAAHLAAMHRFTGLHVDWLVYISSDSVYEVCAPKADPASPTTEGRDDRRPEGAAARAALNAGDPYGHGKLEAEEVFAGWQPRSTWSYAFLRVPDVVGPRDTSYRWWIYQLLIKLQSRIQVPIPYVADDRAGRRLSLVYAADIAQAVVRILRSPFAQSGPLQNRAVNLACTESPWTFMEIMGGIAQELGVSPRSLHYALNATTDFPSVKRGPVSVSQAQAVLGWASTPWPEILRETVSFFEGPAMSDPRFHREREGMLRLAYQHCAKYGRQEALLAAVREVYGLDTSGFDFEGAVNPNDVIIEDEIEFRGGRSEL